MINAFPHQIGRLIWQSKVIHGYPSSIDWDAVCSSWFVKEKGYGQHDFHGSEFEVMTFLLFHDENQLWKRGDILIEAMFKAWLSMDSCSNACHGSQLQSCWRRVLSVWCACQPACALRVKAFWAKARLETWPLRISWEWYRWNQEIKSNRSMPFPGNSERWTLCWVAHENSHDSEREEELYLSKQYPKHSSKKTWLSSKLQTSEFLDDDTIRFVSISWVDWYHH